MYIYVCVCAYIYIYMKKPVPLRAVKGHHITNIANILVCCEC